MTLYFEHNITTCKTVKYVYERELTNLYLALPLRAIMSLAIIILASKVLLAIKKSKRAPLTF